MLPPTITRVLAAVATWASIAVLRPSGRCGSTQSVTRIPGTVQLLGQLELELDELTASAAEDGLAAGTATELTIQIEGFERRRPSRRPFPELHRELPCTAVPA